MAVAAPNGNGSVFEHAVFVYRGEKGKWFPVEEGLWPPGVVELEDAMGIGGLHWMNSGARYKQRTRSTDVLHFEETNSPPLAVEFSCGTGTRHKVTLGASAVDPPPLVAFTVRLDQHQRFEHGESQYKGVEIAAVNEAAMQVLVDQRSTIIELFFSYEPRGDDCPHGVRVECIGFELEAADASMREDFEEMEERFFHNLYNRAVGSINPERFWTEAGAADKPERLDHRAMFGRMLLLGALRGIAEADGCGHSAPRPEDDPNRTAEARAEFGRALFQAGLGLGGMGLCP